MKRFISLFLAVVLYLALIPAFAEADAPITVIDQIGRTVTLAAPAERIVSSYYISTATLIALGLEDRLVGIEMKAEGRTLYQMAAPQIIGLPAVGSGKGINVEETAATNPDVVILPKKLADSAASFEALGIPVVVVDPETKEKFAECVMLLAEITGTTARAEALLSYDDEQTAMIEDLVADLDKPRVYLSSASGTLVTFPGGMYQSALIETAGGTCVSAELAGESQAEVSAEQVVLWNPEYMFYVTGADYTATDITTDERLAGVAAIENDNVYQFPSAIESWDYPTPSSILGILYLAHMLHPDVYTEDQYVQAATDFYRTFFDIDVTKEEIGL